MDSESNGIFGPRGLLARIEYEEECHNRDHQPKRTRIKVSESTPDQSASGEKLIHPKPQESCENLNQCAEDVEDSSSASKAKNLSIVVVPLSDLPPVEAALSIEKISTAIFSMLEPSDLLSCRLVSSSWLQMATNEKLLNAKKNAIWIRLFLRNNKRSAVVNANSRNRRLRDLTEMLDGLGSHIVPCSAVVRLDITPTKKEFSKLFDLYGFVVNSLYLEFIRGQDSQGIQTFYDYGKEYLLEIITKMLTQRVPNLETLQLDIGYGVEFTGSIDPDLLLSIKNGLYFAGKHNQNLRTVTFLEQTPYEIIDAVCCLAPKMDKLVVQDLRFWVECKHRLYLLKTLSFTPCRKDWFEVKAIRDIVNSVDKIDLKWLTISFAEVRTEPQVLPGLAKGLQRIIEKSCHSLEELHLRVVYFLPETVLPRVPNLKILGLTLTVLTPRWKVLPQGISIAATFPILHTIIFFGGSNAKGFLSVCNDEEIASVRRVIGCNPRHDKRALKKLFPNAEFRYNL